MLYLCRKINHKTIKDMMKKLIQLVRKMLRNYFNEVPHLTTPKHPVPQGRSPLTAKEIPLMLQIGEYLTTHYDLRFNQLTEQPEHDIFFRCFRLPLEGEEAHSLSAADIFLHFKKHFPSAMRGRTISQFGKTLTLLGLERIHTRTGNVYRVVKV